MRNIETGEIRTFADIDAAAALKGPKTSDGRWPLWEQSSPADCDPATHATAAELADRMKQAARYGVPVSDVSSDGTPKSAVALAAAIVVHGEQSLVFDPAEHGLVYSAHEGGWIPRQLGFGPNGNDPPFPTWNETTHSYELP